MAQTKNTTALSRSFYYHQYCAPTKLVALKPHFKNISLYSELARYANIAVLGFYHALGSTFSEQSFHLFSRLDLIVSSVSPAEGLS